MAKRFTDTAKWDKQWYRVIGPKLRDLRQYLLDRCDHAGVFEMDLRTFSFYLGSEITLQDVHTALQDEIEKIDKYQYFIPAFIEFQYGELRDNNAAHRSVINRLTKLGIDVSFSSGYSQRPSAVMKRLSYNKKLEIFTQDSFLCGYCGEHGTSETLGIDHILPRSKGGGNDDHNLITCCVSCNSKKTDTDAEIFVLKHNLEKKISPNLKAKMGHLRSLSWAKDKEEDKDKAMAMDKEKDKDPVEILKLIKTSLGSNEPPY